MKVHKSEILIFYNPNSTTDRKTLAIAQGLSGNVITYEFERSTITTTMWHRLITMLDVHPKELINKAHPYYQNNLRGREFDTEDWFNILRNAPYLIKAPIVVSGNKAIICQNPTDVLKLQQGLTA
ncbi:MAG: arsenate reductase [Saprospiraceae bacterium]|jgi:arsenate reductase